LAYDDEGDIITFEFEWIINGVSSGTNSQYLISDFFEAGDTVYCIVTASDGTDISAPFQSPSVDISDVDLDGDGYGELEDCDDSDPLVFPGAIDDSCNGVDNDCDGQIDEDIAVLQYEDLDGDGYGNPDISWYGCPQLEDYVLNNLDCDDSNSAVYPGAEEIADGLDNNCDGEIDSGNFTDQNGNLINFIAYPGTSSVEPQTWAVESAKVVTYRDGTPIPLLTAPGAWMEATTGAYCISPEGAILFNFYAVAGIHDNDPNTPNKEFAPEGWRVASFSDYSNFESILVWWGIVFPSSYSPNSIGKPISSQDHWTAYCGSLYGNPSCQPELNNSSGFNLKPYGRRWHEDGLYYNYGEMTYVWTTTEYIAYYLYGVFPDPQGISGDNYLNLKDGFQVRFIKDD
jgi:hypothetical protein